MKEFGTKKDIIDKMAAMRTLTFFRLLSTKRGYACSMIVHTRADQLLPQLLMELFDTLYIQCKHIEHMHERVWFIKTYYWQNDSYENLDNFSGWYQQKGLCLCYYSAYIGQSTPTTAFD